ncbi:hydrolase [Paenibacillus sp. GCM10027628]|uniref:hydrolase n=1 Tax=Paenibacillus sp. GCM10027628 TaxID=3273413 RepID=UPI003640C5F1
MTNVKTALELNVKKTALVVIDLQKGIANPALPLAPNSAEQVVGQATKLVEAFTEKDAFVVLVRVSSLDGKDRLHPHTDASPNAFQWPEGWDSLIPELAGFQNAHVVTKRQWGAFYGTDLDLQLRRRGIDTIVLCGISTSIGVDTTAREAFQHGYHQVFVEEAMTAMAKEEHDYVVSSIFPKIGKIRTTDEVVAALQ